MEKKQANEKVEAMEKETEQQEERIGDLETELAGKNQEIQGLLEKEKEERGELSERFGKLQRENEEVVRQRGMLVAEMRLLETEKKQSKESIDKLKADVERFRG